MSLIESAMEKLRRGQLTGDRSIVGQAGAIPDAIGSLIDDALTSESGRQVVIDRTALRAAGYLPAEDQNRRFADEYRQIKRPLLANAFSRDSVAGRPNPRLIMMASALPGDGKTFTSINLALSLAREKDSSVVLVDADVAKPHISRIFGVEAERGLLDVLAEPNLKVTSLILPTDVKGLSILPAGKIREGATELLSSSRMADVAGQILARHPRCLALFDSPPLVVTSESRVIAAAVGQVVVVVKAGYTPRQALLDALTQLPEDQIVSLVLNQGRHSLMQGYYSYSYGSYGEEQNVS